MRNQIALVLDSFYILAQLLYYFQDYQSVILIVMLALNIVCQFFLFRQFNAKMFSILITINYIIDAEANHPNIQFYQPIFYCFLQCTTLAQQVPLKLVSIWITIIGFYSLLRCLDHVEAQALWQIFQFGLMYILIVFIELRLRISTVFSRSSSKKPTTINNYTASQKYVDILSVTDRQVFQSTPKLWKELPHEESFIGQLTKQQCFEALKEGVVLFELGFDGEATFLNKAVKNMFQVEDASGLIEAWKKFIKIDQTFQNFNDGRKSYYSNLSCGSEKQISMKNSNSISSHSKPRKDSVRTYSSEQNFYQLLLKLWNHPTKYKGVFYICDQSTTNHVIEAHAQITVDFKRTMYIIFRDIAYKNYIQKLRQNNLQKSKMISFVSHEFRTPLGCIITMLEHEQSQVSSVHIQSAIDNSKYLLNLCNDLLDLAQIKASKFQLRHENFNLKQACQDCMEMFKLNAQKKQLALRLDYSAPDFVTSDRNRIKQIIINLIGNAFKFTQQGQILLETRLQEHDLYEISVSDTGIGIREEDKQKLLSAFGKVNSEESRKLNSYGVGLGLVISSKIAEQVGRGLHFDSVYKKGSMFTFTVQNQVMESQQAQGGSCVQHSLHNLDEYRKRQTPQQIKKLQECRSCKQILVVDDEQFNIDTFKLFLDSLYTFMLVRGFKNVDHTISGMEALERVKHAQPCKICLNGQYIVVFMDLQMPGIDGIQASRMILEEVSIQSKPIIVACSGYSYEEQWAACCDAGMSFYLEKPFQKEDLKQILVECKLIQ